jgi:hypothetical protein
MQLTLYIANRTINATSIYQLSLVKGISWRANDLLWKLVWSTRSSFSMSGIYLWSVVVELQKLMLNIKKLTNSSSDYLPHSAVCRRNVQEIPGAEIILLISSKQRTVLLKAGPESRQTAVVSGNRQRDPGWARHMMCRTSTQEHVSTSGDIKTANNNLSSDYPTIYLSPPSCHR